MTVYTHFTWNSIGLSGQPYPVAHTDEPGSEAKRQVRQLHRLTDADKEHIAGLQDSGVIAYLSNAYPYIDPNPKGPPLVTIERQVVKVSGQPGSTRSLPAAQSEPAG